MGEVYRPEDVLRKGERRLPDIDPETIVKPAMSTTNFWDLIQEVRELRAEVERIKMILKDKGIF